MAAQKEGRGLGESPAAGHSRRDGQLHLSQSWSIAVSSCASSLPFALLCWCWRKACCHALCAGQLLRELQGQKEGEQEQTCFHGLLTWTCQWKSKSWFPGNSFVFCMKITAQSTFGSPPLAPILAGEGLGLTHQLPSTRLQRRSPGVIFRCWNSFITASVPGLQFRAKAEKKGLGLQTCLSSTLSVAWCSSELRLACWV